MDGLNAIIILITVTAWGYALDKKLDQVLALLSQ